ncbi:MAG: sodium:phosphate symporter [Candidatus Nanohaloarchaea archaeon]|nr:sodium:phosphate symporter [Candidatus Nanohaloarchaea archaeon]
MFSLQVLSRSTQTLAPLLEQAMRFVIHSDLSAFGTSWFASYVLLSGSPVAAVSLAFFSSGVLSFSQLFMAVSGSRVGAAFIVVLIGAVEYFRGENEMLRDSCSIGVLTFLIAYLVYVPAVGLGRLLIARFPVATMLELDLAGLRYSLLLVFDPFLRAVFSSVPDAGAFVLGFVLLFVSLEVFDMAFKGLRSETFENRYFRFVMTNTWVSFAAGGLFTLLTTSVSVSLGLIVPLYNRGYLRRKEVIPYILGSNITTLADTLMAAAVLDTVAGFNAVLLLAGCASLVTLIYLAVYERFYAVLKMLFDWIISNEKVFAGFAVSLTVFPLLLMLL